MNYELLSEDIRNAISDAYILAKDQQCPVIEPPLLAAALYVRFRSTTESILSEKSVSTARFRREVVRQVNALPKMEDPSPGISRRLDDLLESCTDGTQQVTVEAVIKTLIETICPHREQRSRPQSSGQSRTSDSQCNDALTKYTRDLNSLAAEGKLSPVIGRNDEIEQSIKALLRKTKSNPVLVGPAGVGKSAIVEGLAQRIAEGNVPPQVASFHIYEVDQALLVAGASAFGQYEARLKAVTSAASADPNIILFFDEIHELIGTGSNSSMDAANILKPALARGEIKLIGATTDDEYRQLIEADKAFERRLQKVRVDELSPEDTLTVLQGIRSSFESYHGLAIDPEAEKLAVDLSQRFLTSRNQPDKAIDVIDTAAATCKFAGRPRVDEDTVREVVSKMAGVPVEKMTRDESLALLALESRLGTRVFGQDQAITAVSSVIRRGKLNLGDTTRPLGVFLFVGPTGSGKTELSKALAEEITGTQDNLIRIDMSEYQQPHSVSRLFGAPPGYVGYGRGGQLTEAVRRKPYSVVLLDEIEKAHPRVFETFLQVFDDGRMTDGEGRVVDFRNTIIIMTSNIGAVEKTQRRTPIGFCTPASETQDESTYTDAVRDHFAPEFINRIDGVIRFHPLDRNLLLRIAQKQLNELATRLEAAGHSTTFEDEVAGFVVDTDVDPQYGARPIRRIIEQQLIEPITLLMLEHGEDEGYSIRVSLREGKPFFDIQ